LIFFPRISLEIKISENTEDIVDRQNSIGYGKYPISDEVAIGGKSDGGKELTDEKPFRDAFRRSFFPLFVNLLDEGEQQYDGAGPPDNFNHFLTLREACLN
jgi:hypothetical protein